MLMKVFNKGQVVIPAPVREELGISVGDMLDVTVDREEKCLRLTKHAKRPSHGLAGSLAKYRESRPLPDRRTMGEVLKKGMTDGAHGH